MSSCCSAHYHQLTTYDSSPKPNRSGLLSTRAMTMAATSLVDSTWNQKTTKLCCLSSSRCASWLSHRLLSSSHCAALSSSCRASWLSHHLSPSSSCTTLSSYRHASLLCVNSPRPLVVLPSCPLIMPAGCCVASPCAPLLSFRRAGHLHLVITLQMSIADAMEHRQMLPPPLHAIATSTIERRIYCPLMP